VSRTLIVNADDFGRSPGINRGIVRANAEGIVTSTSLMVRYAAAAEAAVHARQTASLSVGLHIDLGEWLYADGDWPPVYELAQTAEEVESQLAAFRQLLGCDPTHIDSHQHAHSHEPARSICLRLAAQLGVPLRHFSAIRYQGDFYGQSPEGSSLSGNISVERLIDLIRSLPEGVTELACHPGEAEDLESSYRVERRIELEALCDPRVRTVIEDEGIELRSFADAIAWAGQRSKPGRRD
jgi:predicted glycoside hydrolase/deacetylase ChbG (UPF0249 family)